MIITKTTARQLINDIDKRYPNTYSTDEKITWINDTMREIYKDIAVQEYYSFTTVKGQTIYTLPEDCAIEFIKNVEISSKAKTATNSDWGKFKALKNSLRDQEMFEPSYYDGTEGTIGIFPKPTGSYKVNIYYNKRPKMITSLDDSIELDDRYTDLVKFKVLSIIAMSGHNPDIEIANQYILLYNNLVQEANQSKYEDQQQYPKVRDELRARLRYRRRRLV